jgi:hypothetical protein
MNNGVPPLGFDPNAPGPSQQPRRVDSVETSAYLEWAYNNRVSGFINIPVRYIDFDSRADSQKELHSNLAGLADIDAGFKFALLADPDEYFTFQLRVYTATGDAGRGLGTDHASLEPALLLYERVTDRLTFFGEFRDWIPLGGTDFAGNVIRYGAGLGYDAYRCGNTQLTPIVEFVGWTVLSGKELDLKRGPLDASGDTIVNAKVGARLSFGEHSDIYVGYGRALTGAVWYKDIVRAEYRLRF